MPNPDGTLTLEEKVAKLEKELAEGASRTGEPLVPPTVFKWIAAVLGAAIAAIIGLIAIYPDNQKLQVALVIVGAVGGVFGVASPGLRKAAVVLLCVGALTLTACVHFNKPKLTAGLQQCAAGFVESEVAGIMPDVLKAIQSQKADWQAQLDQVMLRGGTAAICALTVIMSSLESGTGGTGGALPVVLAPPENGGISRAAVLLRAYAYVESRP